jgi:hypothetical protein
MYVIKMLNKIIEIDQDLIKLRQYIHRMEKSYFCGSKNTSNPSQVLSY